MRNLHQLHLRCLCQYLFTGIYKLCLKNFGIIIESEQMSAGSHQSLFRSLEVISFFLFFPFFLRARLRKQPMLISADGNSFAGKKKKKVKNKTSAATVYFSLSPEDL